MLCQSMPCPRQQLPSSFDQLLDDDYPVVISLDLPACKAHNSVVCHKLCCLSR